ncbi:D-alanyl-D-alanine carboxypeptidase [Leucobacter sp. CSA1]|uniref:D-alanyl-D-alanine carboxypeptidase n=1 Tax=Leucobacter chromiisoli TaxID=2796471 RepID=A0A934UV46_9MICO|nr:D-alanyl-D-alanine carboxypeptidase [Leucobacter chromiisoli]MBK0418848.1 D-alanyl-D-alanine carboxypeptidase [Leucobacter chromiisoli]
MRKRWALGTVGALIVAGGGYTWACAATPLPELRVQPAVAETAEFPADPAPAEAAVAAYPQPTAIGWAEADGVWTNDASPHPIASITKLVTALVCLEAAPLAPGEDGPVYTLTEEDERVQRELIALDGVAHPLPAGSQLTTRQLLQLALIPSSNDYAISYARATFGSEDAFLAAVAEWADRNGLETLELVEPSGMDTRNRASADDVVRIARLALQNPTITEITSMPSAEIPGIGVVESTNPLIGRPGVIGLKTGRTVDAGYNLVAAQQGSAADRSVVKIAATLGRATGEDRAASTGALLGAMDALPQTIEVAAEGERIGEVTTWTGETIDLSAERGASAVLLPGESAGRTVDLGTVGAGPSGATAGTIRVETPSGDEDVPVLVGSAIEEPDLWWRLTHPAELFG